MWAIRNVLAVAAVSGLLAAASVGAQRSSSLGITVRPQAPGPNEEIQLVIRGSATRPALLVVLPTRSACPKRTPTSGTLRLDRAEVSGSFSRTTSAYLEGVDRQRFCAYLQPTYGEPGDVGWSPGDPPLARAAIVVTPAFRIPPGVPVGGFDSTVDFGFSLLPTGDGSRFAAAVIYCGGQNRREPFTRKRFTSAINLPVARRLRWSGAAKPDNSGNYSQPIPASWTRPVRLSFDLTLRIEPDRAGVTGIAKLTGPGLPCPSVHRIRAFP